MDGHLHPQGFHLGAEALAALMPMYLWLDSAARVRGMGPTLEKILGRSALGADLHEIFKLRRPRRAASAFDLVKPQRLRLSLRAPPGTIFKGVAVPLIAEGGVVLNLSFGHAVRNAVRDHALSDTDFAVTDLAIELLYLAEAKTAVMAEVNKMAARLQGDKARAEEQALTDALTGLGNRRAMGQALATLMNERRGFALIQLDLDYFKEVNDTLGHAAGDHVLSEVSAMLQSCVRGADLVARVGGDEFVLVLAGVCDTAPVERVGRHILDRMQHPILFEGQPCRVAVSMGAAVAPPGINNAAQVDELMAQADRALYAAKRAGRARLTFVASDGTLNEVTATIPASERRCAGSRNGRGQ